MNKRQLNGRLKTLAHNVMNNLDAHLALDVAFHNQLIKLELQDFVKDRIISWKVDVEINGIKYIGGVKTCHWSKEVNNYGSR